jgi:hypothetical protein
MSGTEIRDFPPEVVYVAACRLTESLTTSPSCSAAAEPYSGFPDGWQMWATTPRLVVLVSMSSRAAGWSHRRKALAVAQDDGVDEQPVLVDEAVHHERSDECRAPTDL